MRLAAAKADHDPARRSHDGICTAKLLTSLTTTSGDDGASHVFYDTVQSCSLSPAYTASASASAGVRRVEAGRARRKPRALVLRQRLFVAQLQRAVQRKLPRLCPLKHAHRRLHFGSTPPRARP